MSSPPVDVVPTPGAGPSCSGPECITCGDIALPLLVTSVTGSDARCRDEMGREELVATELVGAVVPGDRLLVHAGVAIERLSAAETGDRA